MTDFGEDALPAYLHHGAQWLRRVFPDGVPEQQYPAVLALLYSEFSDRDLAVLVAHLTGRDYGLVLNDVYRVQSTPPDDVALASVQQYFNAHGFPDALNDDASRPR